MKVIRPALLASVTLAGVLGTGVAYAVAEPAPIGGEPAAASAPAGSVAERFKGVRWQPGDSPRRAPADTADAAQWTVKLHAVDRSGEPVTDGRASYAIYDLETGAQVAFGQVGSGEPPRLPAGRYSISSMVITPHPAGASRTLVILPETVVTADTAVVLDARSGRQVSVGLDEPQARQVSAAVLVYQRSTSGRMIRYELGAESFAKDTIYVTPTPPRTDLTAHVYTVWTRTDGPSVYNLIGTTDGRVPPRPSFTFRTADLAAVHVRHAAQGVDGCGGTFIGPYLAGRPASVSYGTTFPLPGQRTEYYSTSEDVGWYTEFGQTAADCSFESYDVQVSAPIRYRRGGRHTMAWNTAPVGPTADRDATGQPAASRRGDSMSIGIPMFSDSQLDHADVGGPYAGVTGAVELRRGNKIIASTDTLARFTAEVPVEAAAYRLTATAQRSVAWSGLSSRTETTWDFRSESPSSNDPEALPLLNPRYDIPLDGYNRAAAGRPGDISVQLHDPRRSVPLRAARVDLSVSYDGGRTWQAVRLTQDRDRWRGRVTNPTKGTVSLRLGAVDREGNSVSQTLIDAYLVS